VTLEALIEQKKRQAFGPGHDATDEQALGILIAHHFKWSGDAILRTAASALNDANFNEEAETLAAMAEAL
jgi:hypothetical protein